MMKAARFAAYLALILIAGRGVANDSDARAAGKAPVKAKAATAARPAARVYTLGRNGIDPGIAFGMSQSKAIAAAAAAFGRPGRPGHSDECGEGPMDFVSFGGLQLAFQDGKLAGWSLSGTVPALRTKSGLTVGSPRRALGRIEIDEESSLGPEFEADGIGGVLDEKGARVLALWAGDTCQFR